MFPLNASQMELKKLMRYLLMKKKRWNVAGR